jgi:sterol desaturase/sphingolipid hydroxylase (fatty acid hydroxylase superfamily)/rhodanese-related sulfurtransferase
MFFVAGESPAARCYCSPMLKRTAFWILTACLLMAATSPLWMLRGLTGLVDSKFPSVPQVSSSELASWLTDTNRSSPLLLDIREPDEYAVSHLPGAIRVDPRASDETLRALLGQGRAAVAYCVVGYRSSLFAERAIRAGWTNVSSLRGAIFNWANEGRPLDRDGKPVSLVHGYDRFSSLMLLPEVRAPFPGDPLEGAPILARVRPMVSIGLLLLLLVWESSAPFFPFFTGRSGRGIHGFRNVVLGGINGLVSAVGFIGLWWITANWAAAHGVGLLNVVGVSGWMHAIGAVLLLDVWTYWWHRISHVSRFLWRFHRVHHSDPCMDVTTANRFHLGEMLASGFLRIPVIALIGAHFWEIAVYELLLFSVVQFQHANIWVGDRVDRWLRVLIVTPAMHKVHHSVWQPETDSNYASLLSIWDRLFRSFRLNPAPKTIRLGLDDFSRPDQQTLGGMMATPFEKDPKPTGDGRVEPKTRPARS